jgi:predicted GH43/DUF377 family glycosyl hydrolase
MKSNISPEAELFQRDDRNPILSVRDWPYRANGVFNAGAVRLQDGVTLLLARVEDRRGLSHLTAARSKDGVSDWEIEPQPTLASDPQNHPEEVWGIEDPRIVWVPEMESYSITYTSYSHGGPGVSLAFTKDFKRFDRKGVVMPPDDKDASLFPRRFDGRWLMIHRPLSASRAGHIWISHSPDLKHWGDHMILLEARRGAWWDANKIGLSPPPIETSEGWLMLYHGVRTTAAGCLYRLGLALLDLEDPRKVLLRGDESIFRPDRIYERVGDVSDVVFPCGYTIEDDGDTLRLYYGAADSCICLATGSIRRLLEHLKSYGKPGGKASDF